MNSIQLLIDESRETGWRTALAGFHATHPFFVQRMYDLGLGNWHVLIGLSRDSTALDLGCGFGSLALGLGQYYRVVVGVDALPSRLEFASLRAQQDLRAGNIFARTSGLELSFGEGSFDIVTMNGVLEWAGLYANGDPGRLQIKMLREAKRTLKTPGTIAVAIENRFAMETLVGMRDTHTGLRLVPALPRGLADRLTRAIKNQPFRTYLYDRTGYVRLARDAGFTQARVFDLVSSYNDYDYVIDTRDASSYRFLWRRKAVRSFYPRAGSARRAIATLRPSALGRVSYAYLLLAGDAPLTLLDSTHPFWAKAMMHGIESGPARFACKGLAVGTMIVVTHDGSRPRWIIEIGVGLSDSETSAHGREKICDALMTRVRPGRAWSTDGIGVRSYRANS